MVLVEPDPVIAEPVKLFPRVEVLGIGSRRDLRIEVLLRQRIGQFAADLQMVQLLPIGQQIEDKDFHYLPLTLLPGLDPGIPRSLPLLTRTGRGALDLFPRPACGERSSSQDPRAG